MFKFFLKDVYKNSKLESKNFEQCQVKMNSYESLRLDVFSYIQNQTMTPELEERIKCFKDQDPQISTHEALELILDCCDNYKEFIKKNEKQ